MLAVSANGGFCHASLQAEDKEVLPFAFSSQSTGSSLWFHWMWLNVRLFNELESMLECIHCRARKSLSDTWLARAEVNKMTDFSAVFHRSAKTDNCGGRNTFLDGQMEIREP